MSSAGIFQNYFFQVILLGIPSECKTIRIQIMPDILSGLIWVLNVCKDHQQTTNVAAGRQSVKCAMEQQIMPAKTLKSGTYHMVNRSGS